MITQQFYLKSSKINISLLIYISKNNNANKYEGAYIKVYGNNKNYSIHVRTKFTLAPWQYYAYSFLVQNEWIEIQAPLKDFKKSNFYQPRKFSNQNITSIGLVTAFDNFYTDVCLAEIGFY